jgi:hypothetical protein
MDLRVREYGWAYSIKRLFRTSDDGAHWDTLHIPSTSMRSFVALNAMSGLYVQVVGKNDSGQYFAAVTSDGGITWQEGRIQLNSLDKRAGTVGDQLADGTALCLRGNGSGNGPTERVSFRRTQDGWKSSSTDFVIGISREAAYNGIGTPFSLDANTAWAWIGDRLYFTSTGGIDAADAPPEPTSLTLSQNYPNPFTTHTTIPYSIAGSGAQQLRIELYDAMGRRVATLYDGTASAGEHVLPFDASGLVPGMYFVRLVTGGRMEVRKMVVVGGR